MGYFFFREALNGVRFLPSASYLIRNMSYVTINFTGNTKKWVWWYSVSGKRNGRTSMSIFGDIM